MDHKVSKDMISSGMIPSGEKTQADLGRTQYGSAPSPSSLMEAYRSIYEHHQKDKDGNTVPHQEDLNEGKMPEGLKNYLMKKGKKDDKKEDKKEKVDENLMQGLKTIGRDIGSAASTVYKDVKGAIKNRYQKFKDHQAARSMGMKGGKISPSGVYSSRSKDGGFGAVDLRFDTDLFDLVKGDLISEGLTDSEASRMMIEMHEEIAFLYSISEMPLSEMQGQINRADIIGGTQAAKNAAAGKGKYTPGKGVTKDFKLDPSFKLPKA